MHDISDRYLAMLASCSRVRGRARRSKRGTRPKWQSPGRKGSPAIALNLAAQWWWGTAILIPTVCRAWLRHVSGRVPRRACHGHPGLPLRNRRVLPGDPTPRHAPTQGVHKKAMVRNAKGFFRARIPRSQAFRKPFSPSFSIHLSQSVSLPSRALCLRGERRLGDDREKEGFLHRNEISPSSSRSSPSRLASPLKHQART